MLDREATINKLGENLDFLTGKVEDTVEILRDSDRGFFSEYEAITLYLASVLISLDSKLDALISQIQDSNES